MMLPAQRLLREQLREIISGQEQQVHVVVGLREELDSLPDRYDALVAFGEKLAALPLRDDWLYVEPSDLAAIWAARDPTPSQGCSGMLTPEQAARPVERPFFALFAAARWANRSRSRPHCWNYSKPWRQSTAGPSHLSQRRVVAHTEAIVQGSSPARLPCGPAPPRLPDR